MKITLDIEEVGKIVTEWARRQYSTRNVSATFSNSPSGMPQIDLEVFITDMELASPRQSLDKAQLETLMERTAVLQQYGAAEPTHTFNIDENSRTAPI